MAIGYKSVLAGMITALNLVTLGYATSKMCFDCKAIPYPRTCDNVMQCGPDSECYTEQFITSSGTLLYNTGCRSIIACGRTRRSVTTSTNSDRGLTSNVTDVTDIVVEQSDNVISCEDCCDGDYCNSKGCGSKALPPLSSRGPVCFNCHQQEKHNSCYSVQVCDLNEKCSDLQIPDIPMAAVGRRDSNTCQGCCGTDFCNRDCSTLQSQPINTSTALSTQAHTTTAPPTASTTTFSIKSSTTVSSTEPSTESIGTTNPSSSTASSAFSSSSSIFVPSSTTDVHSVSSTRHVGTKGPSSTKVASTFMHTLSTAKSTVTNVPSSTRATPTSSSRPTDPTTTLAPEYLCQQKGYTYNTDYHVCYKFYHDYKLTWEQSRQRCIRDKGNLIMFKNKPEETYFANLFRYIRAQPTYWVGASDTNYEGWWTWVDGSPVDTSLFHPGQPDNKYEEDCGVLTTFGSFLMSSTLMNDERCSNKEYSICEIVFHDVSTTHSTPRPCRNTDYQYDSKTGICYKIYKQAVPQRQARLACLSQSADLLILRNKTVESVFQDMHFYDNNINHRYWLGGYRIQGDTRHTYQAFRWYNGREMDPGLQWHSGEPNYMNSVENCLTFTYFPARYGGGYNDFTLNDANCFEPYWYICEERCPDRTYHYDSQLGLCFKVYNDKVNWDEAEQRCAQDKTDLLELTDDKALIFLQSHLQNASHGSYWIGARDYSLTEVFQWLTLHADVPTNLWHTGYPSSSKDGRHCGALEHSQTDNSLGMVDRNCNAEKHGFICQHIW